MGIQPVLLKEPVHPAHILRGAQVGKQQPRATDDGFPGSRMKLCTVEKSRQYVRLGCPVQVPHCGTVASKSHGG